MEIVDLKTLTLLVKTPMQTSSEWLWILYPHSFSTFSKATFNDWFNYFFLQIFKSVIIIFKYFL